MRIFFWKFYVFLKMRFFFRMRFFWVCVFFRKLYVFLKMRFFFDAFFLHIRILYVFQQNYTYLCVFFMRFFFSSAPYYTFFFLFWKLVTMKIAKAAYVNFVAQLHSFNWFVRSESQIIKLSFLLVDPLIWDIELEVKDNYNCFLVVERRFWCGWSGWELTLGRVSRENQVHSSQANAGWAETSQVSI